MIEGLVICITCFKKSPVRTIEHSRGGVNLGRITPSILNPEGVTEIYYCLLA